MQLNLIVSLYYFNTIANRSINNTYIHLKMTLLNKKKLNTVNYNIMADVAKAQKCIRVASRGRGFEARSRQHILSRYIPIFSLIS